MGWLEKLLAGYIRSRLISSEQNVGGVTYRMFSKFGPSDATNDLEVAYHGRTTEMQADEEEFH